MHNTLAEVFSDLIGKDRVKLPFKSLSIPQMGEWSSGHWTLMHEKTHPPIVRGYFRGMQPWPTGFDGGNWVLRKKDTIWMSLSPMELESQGHHAFAARGRVLVMGLGMGVLLANVMRKGSVKEVVVVEREQAIIDMVRNQIERFRWAGARKVTFVCYDALKYEDISGYDVALVDIWPSIGDTAIRRDMQRIARNVPAKEYAAWSGELDFISWCMEAGVPAGGVKGEHWGRYSDGIGVPLIFKERHWMAPLAVRAAENVVLF